MTRRRVAWWPTYPFQLALMDAAMPFSSRRLTSALSSTSGSTVEPSSIVRVAKRRSHSAVTARAGPNSETTAPT